MLFQLIHSIRNSKGIFTLKNSSKIQTKNGKSSVSSIQTSVEVRISSRFLLVHESWGKERLCTSLCACSWVMCHTSATEMGASSGYALPATFFAVSIAHALFLLTLLPIFFSGVSNCMESSAQHCSPERERTPLLHGNFCSCSVALACGSNVLMKQAHHRWILWGSSLPCLSSC